ncbi:hypothetical protein KO164_3851 [Thalassospira sp. KO164]|nr:hypothetical protein KO164_3851 [Thalassospira sp. KO164]SEE79403.1 hypothetical protein SAMN04515623_3897 [Thalassospira permensis]
MTALNFMSETILANHYMVASRADFFSGRGNFRVTPH